ncbi:transmembrane protein [Ceratobasidium sp. AG-Ba]|nr:transmembrane protein [Ceratobasidium sp. AG-Ba]
MPELNTNYRELFVLKTFQRGRPTALAVSPLGRWLCSTTDNGDLLIQRLSRGIIYCHVGMGRFDYATSICWVTDLQLLIGSSQGNIYVATLNIDKCNEEKQRIEITRLLHDVNSPIRALAYDSNRKLLALGYKGHVSIWRYQLQPGRGWGMLDIFRTNINGVSAKVNSLDFFGSCSNLLLGLESGLVVWYAKGELHVVDTGLKVCHVGSTAISTDHSTLAVSTLDQSILVWPLSTEGPIGPLVQEYPLESGREWHIFESRTPVAFTSETKIVCGTLDGTVDLITHNGLRIQRLTNANYCTRALATYGSIVYASFTSPVGYVVIVAYSNSENRIARSKEKCGLEQNPHFYLFNKVYRPPNPKRKAKAPKDRSYMAIFVVVLIIWGCWWYYGLDDSSGNPRISS